MITSGRYKKMEAVQDFKVYAERLIQRLLNDNTISKENKTIIQEYYSDLLVMSSYKDATICNKLQILPLVFETYHEDLTKLTKKDIKILLAKIETHETPGGKRWCLSTKFNYKSKLKQFIKYLHTENFITEPLDLLIKPKMPLSTIQPQDIPNNNEAELMISNALNLRDKAMIALVYDIGARIGEVLSMKIKHYIDDVNGGQVTITGKTGTRTIQLCSSIFYMRQWINAHPEKNNPEAWMWCHIININNSDNGYGRVGYQTVYLMFNTVGKRAGIKKKTTPHRFRHAAVTNDCRNLSESLVKIKFGWTRSSNMLGRYSHVECQNLNDKILEQMGVVPEKTKKGTNRCPNCGDINPNDFKWCGKCGYGLNEAVRQEKDSIITNILSQLQKNPEILAEALTRIKT